MSGPPSDPGSRGSFRGDGNGLVRRLRFDDLFGRLLIDLVLAGVVLGALSAGGMWLLIVLVASVLAAEVELYGALQRDGRRPMTILGLLGGVAMMAGTAAAGLIAVPVTILAVAVFAALRARSRLQWEGAGWTVLGVTWVAGGLAFIWPIARAQDGLRLLVATAALLAAFDSGQLLVGRAVGRRPLAPRLSPRKTVEGLLGGIVLAVVAAFLVARVAPFHPGSALALAAVIIVVGPPGDLAVSSVKRTVGLKDLGTLAREHGGVMDLLDSALFVLPAVWLLFQCLGLLH